MPKTGRRVVFQGQEVDVVDQNVLTRKLTLRLSDGRTVEAAPEEIDRATETAGASPAAKPALKKEPPAAKSGGRPRRPSPKAEGKPVPPRPQPAAETPPAEAPPATIDEAAPPAAKKRSRSRRRPRRNK